MMNRHLTIRNFGPIKQIEMEVLDYNILIGNQATGKSTIAKAVYFFLSLRDDLREYLPAGASGSRNRDDFERKIRNKFSGFWGMVRVNPSLFMNFRYSPGYEISLDGCGGYINVGYSPMMGAKIDALFRKVNASDPAKLSAEIEKDLTAMFEQHGADVRTEIVYIPAGRSILSILPDAVQQQILGMTSVGGMPELPLLDLPVQNFLKQITQLKPLFNKPLHEVIEDKQALAPTAFKPDTASLEIARQLIFSILKGKYRYDKTGEVIEIDDRTSVKLSFASSGQQESLWILMQLFSLILNRTKAFVVIEEPEAHLFPETQKYMTDLMSLIANVNGNQMMITTHSPYILTSLNNHIYAEQVGRQHREVSQIVDPALWMHHRRVNALYADDGIIRSVMDEELNLIKAEEIDGASQIINSEFSMLADIPV